MHLFILSENYSTNNQVGWAVNYTLETTLASACDVTFLCASADYTDGRVGVLKRYRQRLLKSWFELKDLPTLGSGPNVLLIVAMTPFFLLSMHALGPLLKQFDLRVAYVLDGFPTHLIDRAVVPDLDHLFVIDAEIAAEIKRVLPIATTFLPLATDALRFGSNTQQRTIDIINYGRTNAALHRRLQSHYLQSTDRFYFHSTFTESRVHNLGEHVALLSKLLSRSRLSLCFEASHLERFGGRSPLLFRWFEGWANGCTIVGKKPFGQGVAPLMDWEHSTIELPDEPSAWIPFFEALLGDKPFLAANARRNTRECLLRHDWRYRLKDLFTTLELPLPEKLKAGLVALQQLIEQQRAGDRGYSHEQVYSDGLQTWDRGSNKL